MIHFLWRRLGFMVFTLILIIYLTNFGLLAARGAQRHAPLIDIVSEAAAQSIQYATALLNGKLGETTIASVLGNRGAARPIGELALEAYLKSMGLLFIAVSGGSLIGITLGTIAALQRQGVVTGATWVLALAGISTPSFFLAIFLQLGAAAIYQKTAVQVAPVYGFGWDSHLILPSLVLAARPLAHTARLTFTSLSQVLKQDYIRTAHAKGLRNFAVFNDHATRNAAISILTAVGVSLRFSFSTLPIVEAYFGWQGAAQLLLNALFRDDHYAAITLLLMLGATFMLVNLLLDLSYRFIDPRVR
jgi:ABC-type dipeptide/oligopeptide/nickel transport system permease component